MANKPFSIFTSGDRNDHSKIVDKLLSHNQPPLRAKSAPRRPSSANHHAPAHRALPSKHRGNKGQASREREVISKEDLIIDLSETKKKNKSLEETISQLKSENQRLEADANKQQRRIDQLLNLSEGAKNIGLSAEIRRDIEKSILVRQLKVQINNLRNDIAEKENELENLRRSIKTTHMLELENERDECFIEIQRLKNALREMRDEVVRERQRREWNSRLAGDKGDEVRRELARLSAGYQNVLTNMSNRLPGSRPSTAGNSGGRAGGSRANGREPTSGHHDRAERSKRPQSANAGVSGKPLINRFDSDLDSPYLSANPHSPINVSSDLPTSTAVAAAPAGTSNQDGDPRPHTEMRAVFTDPLDNFGLAAPDPVAGTNASLPVDMPPTQSGGSVLPAPTPAGNSIAADLYQHENGNLNAATEMETVRVANAVVPNGPSGSKFPVGARVQGFLGGGPEWCDGTIRAVNPDGTYQVRYDGGDIEQYVLLTNLRRARNSSDECIANTESEQQAVMSGAAPAHNVGDAVEALYYNGETWYTGKIQAVHPSPTNRTDFVYDIRYDDGDRELKVASSKVRSKVSSAIPSSALSPSPALPAVTTYTKGQRVQGFFSEYDSWYPGVVRLVNGDGTYAIDFDDGDKEDSVPTSRLQPINPGPSSGESAQPTVLNAAPAFNTLVAPKFVQAEKVEALYGGGPSWYPATVSKVHGGGSGGYSYDLAYDDGDNEYQVREENVRSNGLLSSSSAGPPVPAVSAKVAGNNHHVVNTNLDSFLNELSDDDSTGVGVGVGVEAGPNVLTLKEKSRQPDTSTPQSALEDEYGDDFDA